MASVEPITAAQYGSVYPLPYQYVRDPSTHRPILTIPLSDVEKQRLRKQHQGLMGIMHNNPIHAPVSDLNPKKIVDVGCGMNADMTMYFAKRFPNAQVYAVDLAPVNIPKEHIPPNVEFIQGNITDLIDTDPRLASGSVDFLYSRLLASGMQDWKKYFECVASLLRRGGVVEMHDLADVALMRMSDGKPAFENSKWQKHSFEATSSKTMSLDLGTFRKADVVLREVGLQDTNIKEYRLNWGSVKADGEEAWIPEGQSQWYNALNMFMTYLVSSEDQALRDEILKEVHEQAKPPVEGVYFPFYVVWGRKP